MQFTTIGQPTTRVEGQGKVTGATRYTADVALPGTLWGRALRSPLPHARLIRIDTSRAQQVPGIHTVLTGADVRGIRYGRRLFDVPVLAEDRVRFAGERVAAVAAEDRDAAEEALALIDVEYEELPAVFDPLQALGKDAPILHPEVNSYIGLPTPLETPSNAFVRDTWSKGTVAEGFAQADLIIENTFTVPRQHQAYLETHSCLVWIDEQGRVQVWASSKVPYQVKEQLSVALRIPKERIRLNPVAIGGDYGGKGSPMDIPVAYILALRTGRPVKMVMDYVEELSAGNPRHAAIIQLKTGVTRDGTILAHQARVLFDSGAYGGFKPTPAVNLGGASKAGGPYRIPHVHIEGVQVYTNTIPGGFMRAPGEPQAVFAIESHIDCLARRVGMDPLDFRLKNLIEAGDETPVGMRYRGIRAKETLEAAVAAAGYRTPKAPHIGRGIAIGERPPAGGESHAAVTLQPDGSVIVHTSIFEPGTGTYTILRQIVAEELHLAVTSIQVEVWDTDAVPFDTGVGGSRVTRVAGQAAYQAAREASRAMLRLAADLLDWPEESVVLRGPNVIHQETGQSHPWAELLQRHGEPVVGRGAVHDMNPSPVTSFTAQVAEVSVDPETGEVQLLRFTTAHDVGRVLNPMDHQSQIEGAVVQAIGYGLSEELGVDEGKVTTVNLGDYKIPNVKDIPELKTVVLESESGPGPYNARGIGENPLGPVAPAIANAVEDAVGVRIRDLPITAEKVYRSLTEG
ncbi:MAG TPA: xanthine dehydrogenase family protein molybdopterin-binding subunit [Candidatus Tectomicrobia bacterium]|nr:xanthine dehydrogenase family protein molybdopterin-binding subunit [Candidatus Tectomicrobia bacterium]